MLTHKDILHYGSIISLKIYRSENKFMCADGYGFDKVMFDDFDEEPSRIFSKSLFLVLPTFNDEKKKEIMRISDEIKDLSYNSKKERCAELLRSLFSEYNSNIEVLETNITTPIKFNVVMFQLYHLNSNKYLSMSEPQSTTESMRLSLVDQPGSNTTFKFTNSLKYQIEGENLIYFGTPVKLSSTLDLAGLNPSLQCSSNRSMKSIEPVMSVESDTDIEIVYFKTEAEEIVGQTLRGGDLVMLSQLDHSIVLCVKNDLDQRIKKFMNRAESEKYELTLTSFLTKEFMDSISFTNSIWVVEHESKKSGEDIKWNNYVRFLNLAAKKYLCLDTTDEENYHFVLGDLNQDKVYSLFEFISPSIENFNQAINTNDYVSIKLAKSRYFLGVAPESNGSVYKIQSLTKQLDENTFKIMKSDKFSNEISYYQVSTYTYLSELLQHLKDFKYKRDYKNSQQLRKKIFQTVKLITSLRDFTNNRYLISNIKEKYAQRNPMRQEFLATQQYILFCSLVLGDIFDIHEINILTNINEDDPNNKQMIDAINGRINLDDLMKGASFREKASSKITADDVLKNFMDLLKAKVYLANEIYGLLKDICRSNSENQIICYECCMFYLNQFSALPASLDFLSYLICENNRNAMMLMSNFNYQRIRDSIPNSEMLELDIVIKDPQEIMTKDFSQVVRPQLLLDEKPEDRRRAVNPLVFSCIILSHTDSDKMKLKCLKFLTNICQVIGQPCAQIQDQLYKLTTLVPQITRKMFKDFYINEGELYYESGDNDPKTLSSILA